LLQKDRWRFYALNDQLKLYFLERHQTKWPFYLQQPAFSARTDQFLFFGSQQHSAHQIIAQIGPVIPGKSQIHHISLRKCPISSKTDLKLKSNLIIQPQEHFLTQQKRLKLCHTHCRGQNIANRAPGIHIHGISICLPLQGVFVIRGLDFRVFYGDVEGICDPGGTGGES